MSLRDSQTSGANGEVLCESQNLFYFLYLNHSQQRLFPTLCVTLSSCCTRCWNISLPLPPSNTHSPCLPLAVPLLRLGETEVCNMPELPASPPASKWGEVLGHMSRSGIEHLYEMCFLFLGRLYFLLNMQCPQGRLHWVKPNVSLSSILLLGRNLSPLQGGVCDLRKYTYT